MLAVFDKSVAKGPDGLTAGAREGSGGPSMLDQFATTQARAVTVGLGGAGALGYSSEKRNPLLPRSFAVLDDIFCVFEGRIDNIADLKHRYGLGKDADEVIIVIEAFRTLRDRGPYPADQVVKDLRGKFAFILFDSSSKTVFIATDEDGSVPFFWGTDPDGRLVLCDDIATIKRGCGKSFAPFPKGCFFTSSRGLQSFEHPMNEMKAMPRIDSQGQVCGANFKVDEQARRGASMPRVGSEANWSSQY